MQELKWPETPTCHNYVTNAWRSAAVDDGGPYQHDYRTCNYCGSMHPEDFLKAMEAGAVIEEADWKYGWPHKFYVLLPNPKAGQECRVGSKDGVPIMGKAPSLVHAKWYNEHLAELEPETFAKVTSAIMKQTVIQFLMEDGKLKFRLTK